MSLPRKQDSPSSLNTFAQCRRRYDYDYLRGNPRNGWTSIEAAMGSAVHKAIEEFLLNDTPLLPTFGDELRAQLDSGVVISPKPERDEEWADEVGRQCLVNFADYHARHLKDKGLTFEVEKEVAIRPREGWKVRGFADCVAFDDHTVWVIDWKTGSRGPFPRFQNSTVAGQLGIYAAAVADEHPDKRIMVAAVYLADSVFKKNPDGYEAEASRQSLVSVERWVGGLAGEIEEAQEEQHWFPSPGPLCGWCRWAREPIASKWRCREGEEELK